MPSSPILDLRQQRFLLELEYQSEKQAFEQQTEAIGLQRKVKRGDAWYPVRAGRDVIASERRRSDVFSVNGDCCARGFGYEVADGIAVGFRLQRNRERGYLSRLRRDCGCDALVSVKRVLYRVYAEEHRQVVYRRRSYVFSVHCHGCAGGV